MIAKIKTPQIKPIKTNLGSKDTPSRYPKTSSPVSFLPKGKTSPMLGKTQTKTKNNAKFHFIWLLKRTIEGTPSKVTMFWWFESRIFLSKGKDQAFVLCLNSSASHQEEKKSRNSWMRFWTLKKKHRNQSTQNLTSHKNLILCKVANHSPKTIIALWIQK